MENDRIDVLQQAFLVIKWIFMFLKSGNQKYEPALNMSLWTPLKFYAQLWWLDVKCTFYATSNKCNLRNFPLKYYRQDDDVSHSGGSGIEMFDIIPAHYTNPDTSNLPAAIPCQRINQRSHQNQGLTSSIVKSMRGSGNNYRQLWDTSIKILWQMCFIFAFFSSNHGSSDTPSLMTLDARRLHHSSKWSVGASVTSIDSASIGGKKNHGGRATSTSSIDLEWENEGTMNN